MELAAVDALEEQGQYAKAIASLERLLASVGKGDGGAADATWWDVVQRLVRRYQVCVYVSESGRESGGFEFIICFSVFCPRAHRNPPGTMTSYFWSAR